MRLIDSHCHLNYAGLVERQDEVLDNARRRGVVERRLRDPGHARNVFAAPADTQELSDRPRQCRDAARRAAAVGAVASLTVERVVERRAAHVGRGRDARRDEHDGDGANHDRVATPSTTATEQFTARLLVPKHQRRSLFFDVK